MAIEQNAGRFDIKAYIEGWPISVYVNSGHPNDEMRINADDIEDLIYALQRIHGKIAKGGR